MTSDVVSAFQMNGDNGRMLQGMLLQLELPAEVKPSHSTAQRSNASGKLLLTMPREQPEKGLFNVACCRCHISYLPVSASPGCEASHMDDSVAWAAIALNSASSTPLCR